MRSLSKVTKLFTLLSFMMLVSFAQVLAQNTAPVPTTFEILSPSDGNLPFLINQVYGTGAGQNNTIFYGGDFAPAGPAAKRLKGFQVWQDLANPGVVDANEIKARGNRGRSRLTLGGTEYWDAAFLAGAEPPFGTAAGGVGGNIVENLGWRRLAAVSFDLDDLGSNLTGIADTPVGTYLSYTGCVGFIAINEEDSLAIRLTGYIDPNNRMKYPPATANYVIGGKVPPLGGAEASDKIYGGTMIESREYAYDIANPINDGTNGIEFGIVPSTLPQGATFSANLFTWTPNFIQGDGDSGDNSVRNGWIFVDANISDGDTDTQVDAGVPNTTGVGYGLGELRDSLYVVYFTASDDGIPPMTGVDSLFIMVNDSIKNPPPIFTHRIVLDSAGNEVTHFKNSVDWEPLDSALAYHEGDSIVVTFYATDQDSARGEVNDELEFTLPEWDHFVHSTFSSLDSTVGLDTASVLVDGSPKAFRVRLNLAYNISDYIDVGVVDTLTLVVNVWDGWTEASDTMLFRVLNANRAPIWDQDTLTKPSDSAMVWAFDPAAVEPDRVEEFYPIAVANNTTDSIYFQQWVYDPDPQIGDNLGPLITISQIGAPEDIVFDESGLMVVTMYEPDTVSIPFTISAEDNNYEYRRSSEKALLLRVAPEPDIDRIYPPTAAPGDNITIFGSGFGLYNETEIPGSRVRFRARNAAGAAQNIVAVINSWSRDRINLSIPVNTPVSKWDPTILPFGDYVPDTIEVNSSVFAFPTYYPYLITEPDTTRITELELTNLTPTSAVIKWKTGFTGIDSVILATDKDTLDITSSATLNAPGWPAPIGGYWPTFVVEGPGNVLTQTKSNVLIYRGTTTATDEIHYVKLTDLNPGTTYKFIIGMKDNLFFGDLTHNQNGPWYPSKIDRSNPGTTDISGFRLRTPPAQATGETFVITGKAFTTSGGPAINALVTVKVVDYENVADTSLGLVTTVATDSTWEINLAGALKDTTGVQDRLFPHKEGDYLVITIRGDVDVGYAQFVVTRGAAGSSPQVVSTEAGMLMPSVAYDIRLKLGLNLIGIPVNPLPTEISMAEALLNALGGGTPSITKYDPSGGEQLTIIRVVSASGRQFVGVIDFPLVLYEAYFVLVEADDWLNIEGSLFADTLPVLQFPGSALYWISRPAQESSKFYAWSARSMLANIEYATEIFRFDEDDQMYENAVLILIAPDEYQFIGENFHIDVSEGYILRVTFASQWDIDIPASVLLASTNDKFNGVATEVPAITLNTSGEGLVTGSGAARAIRLSDVTSSAAKISWVTDITGDALVRYGKAEEGLDQVAYLSIGLLDQGMCMVHLLNLEPETGYIYEIVSNGVTYNDNGQPFTLVTAKVGIGHPYTVYGRVVDEQGAPLAKTLIYVEAKRGESRSTPLLAITDDRGFWNVNLANLKTGEGLVYQWNVGDEIRATVVHRDASLTFRTLVSGESPQNVVNVEDPAAGTASKKEVSRVSLPKAFALGQNFPNPFNPSTTIAFDIPEAREEGVNVELNVYNIRGQLVRALVNEVKKPGHYTVQWNGLNEKGEVVSSGVYFYRIKAGGYVATRKMVLLK